ncbi:MAG: hypothetical protein ACKO1J_13150 [Tagaea sp.]
MRPFIRFALPALVALGLAACDKTPTIQGSPPFTAVPKKVTTFVAPYEDALLTFVGPGTIATAVIVGPHFLPGACDGLWASGDRKLVCDARARYLDEPKEAKPDPNMRLRCIRTLGGGTECVEAGQ